METETKQFDIIETANFYLYIACSLTYFFPGNFDKIGAHFNGQML